MQYPGGSASESSGMSGGVGSHRNGSAGSSPDFPSGGYDSAEHGDSPPDSTYRGSTGGGHLSHPYHTPPALETSYAGAPMGSGMPYHSPASYGSSAGTGYNTSTRQTVNYPVGGSGGYVYTGNGGDYPSPTARSHPSGIQHVSTTWRASDFGFAGSSRPRHSDSPPLSPIDTTSRSNSYFPATREYALNAVGSAVPSSPTTPSSVSDSPSTPFSPHYASSPYGGSTHGHSHSHSSSSASGYIQGTPLPSLQLNTGHAGGHFVPPTGNDYPIPASPSPYSPSHHGYGRSSPPDHARMPSGPPTAQPSAVGPLAGPGFASRPFLCDDCGMNFARTHDLKRHQTTHVPGVKKTHPCPYCGKNLSRRDAIKRHVVSKQCPVANDKGYGWPPPEGHVPPPPDTHIERASRTRGENPYPVLAVSPGERSGSYSSGYGNGSPGSPGPYSPNGYSNGPGFNGVSSPGGYGDHGPGAPAPAGVVFEYDHRSSAYRGR